MLGQGHWGTDWARIGRDSCSLQTLMAQKERCCCRIPILYFLGRNSDVFFIVIIKKKHAEKLRAFGLDAHTCAYVRYDSSNQRYGSGGGED